MRRIQRISLYLFFFSINFEVWDPFNTGGFFSISKLMGFIYLFAMLPMIVSSNTKDETKSLLWPVWLFFGILTFVNIFEINSTLYNFFDITIFQNIVLFWILINHESSEPQILEKGILSFALGSVVLTILFYFDIGVQYSLDGRVSIFGDNQNNIGIRTCISIFILIHAALQNTLQLNKLRFILFIPIPIMLHLMALSGSRVAMAAFILTFIIGGILIKTKTIWRKLLIFIFATLSFIAIWQYLMQTEVLKLRLLQSIYEGDLSGRDIIWQKIIPIIKNNPVFGIGTVGYNHFTLATFGEIKSPHNVFLEVLCYTGIVGLAVYLIFLFKILKKVMHIYKTAGILLPLLLLISIFGLLVSGQILSVKTGWIIFAYIAGISLNTSSNELQDEISSDN
jgi:O-antigen ligase